ncbi:MAG TPA: nucleotidyltransferase family protein [Gemmatimonadaceae bacterium]|nr:nucleotidyltransferase family protein [Gemmatimonadaceae bacterium]
MARLGVIVLAAGRSTRYAAGGHKLLARVGHAPVVRHAVLAAVNSGVGDVVVVTGAESEAVARAVADLPVRVEHEPQYAEGMAVSLKRGVSTLRDSADAILVALGDEPGMRPGAYRRVVGHWLETRASIVVPCYAGSSVPAHPTLFNAAVYHELLALHGDVGARAVVTRDPSRVAEAALEWPAPCDVDTQDDLAAVTEELSAEPNAEGP